MFQSTSRFMRILFVSWTPFFKCNCIVKSTNFHCSNSIWCWLPLFLHAIGTFALIHIRHYNANWKGSAKLYKICTCPMNEHICLYNMDGSRIFHSNFFFFSLFLFSLHKCWHHIHTVWMVLVCIRKLLTPNGDQTSFSLWIFETTKLMEMIWCAMIFGCFLLRSTGYNVDCMQRLQLLWINMMAHNFK